MGNLFTKEAIYSDCQIVREIQKGDIVMDAKGRVTCSCVCEKAGLILVAVGEVILSWRFDGSFFREFDVGAVIETIVECNSGYFFLAGGCKGFDAKFAKVMLTRRIADLPFHNITKENTSPDSFTATDTISLGPKGDVRNGKMLSSILHIICLDNSLSETQQTERCVLFSRPFVIIYSVKDKSVLQVIPQNCPLDISVKACVLPNSRIIVASESCGLSCLKPTAGAVRLPQPDLLRGMRVTALANAGYNVFVAGDCGRVLRFNALSKQCLMVLKASPSIRANGIGRVLTCMGVVIAIPKDGKGVQVWDGKCGRELGEMTLSFTALNSVGCCVFGSWLLVVDSPQQGMGFKTLLKTYDMRKWFSDVNWLPSYNPCWSVDYVQPAPPLQKHAEATGPLATVMPALQQPSGQVILGDQIQLTSNPARLPAANYIPARHISEMGKPAQKEVSVILTSKPGQKGVR